jgi:hypothetical protein
MTDALTSPNSDQAASDHQVTFPDGCTEMLAGELPVGCSGYVDDYAGNIGVQSLDYAGSISKYGKVYAAPADGRRAKLVRNSSGLTLYLPPGESWGGRSRFGMRFPSLPD